VRYTAVVEERPEHEAGATGQERRLGRGRHVRLVQHRDQGARRAEQGDREGAAPVPQPAARRQPQTRAADEEEEDGRQSREAQGGERRHQKRVAGVLLADPVTGRRLRPLHDADPAVPAVVDLRQLGRQLSILCVVQCHVAVEERGDRRPVGIGVRLAQLVCGHEGERAGDDDARQCQRRRPRAPPSARGVAQAAPVPFRRGRGDSRGDPPRRTVWPRAAQPRPRRADAESPA